MDIASVFSTKSKKRDLSDQFINGSKSKRPREDSSNANSR